MSPIPRYSAPTAPPRKGWGVAQWLRLLAVVGVLALAVDQTGPPAEQVATRFLLGGIDLYQATLSPRMPALGVRCRFRPTCSRYGEASIHKYGAMVGSARTAWRILRCAPWTPAGTYDPP